MTKRIAYELALRNHTLRQELADPYTILLGAAAVRAVATALEEHNSIITSLPPADQLVVARMARRIAQVLT